MLANSVKHKNRGKEGYHRKTVEELFLKTDIFLKIQNASFAFLAVQNSSIGDHVTHSLTQSETFDFSVYNDNNDYNVFDALP